LLLLLLLLMLPLLWRTAVLGLKQCRQTDYKAHGKKKAE
jgi:hypothetical protein